MLRRALLLCGLLSSILYVGIDVLAAVRYPGYHSFTARMISELMAEGAPTERLVDPLFLLYDVLVMAFAGGVYGGGTRASRTTGILLFLYGAVGLTGPTLFEMNVRGTGDPARDVAHAVVTGVLVVLLIAAIVAGAALHGRRFRIHSYATLATLVGLGALSAVTGRGLATGEEVPWFGLTERLLVGAFLLWIALLAVASLHATRPPVTTRDERPDAGLAHAAR